MTIKHLLVLDHVQEETYQRTIYLYRLSRTLRYHSVQNLLFSLLLSKNVKVASSFVWV
jgi:hypothetical protein